MEGEQEHRQEAFQPIYKITSKLSFRYFVSENDLPAIIYIPNQDEQFIYPDNFVTKLSYYLLNEWHELFACNSFETVNRVLTYINLGTGRLLRGHSSPLSVYNEIVVFRARPGLLSTLYVLTMFILS